jgi:hypothetical protein
LKLQTHIPFSKEKSGLIDYSSKIILLGSCFSENIGNKFDYLKFQAVQNPFGILFHPKAIETIIKNAINKKKYTEKDVFFLNERWHSFEAHSQLSSSSKVKVLQQLNNASKTTNKSLKDSSHIIITLGTSWVYRIKESGLIVANCHKVPQHKFQKELLSISEIIESLELTISLIKEINPTIIFIFTASPIRHLKDGFIENQQSKSHLIAAIHQAIKTKENSFYFPSYELMMDELRDYRFYEEDMIHPNSIAINYIWEKFLENWISNDAKKIIKEIIKIQKDINHKPFNFESKEHTDFLKSIEYKIKRIQKKNPEIYFK